MQEVTSSNLVFSTDTEISNPKGCLFSFPVCRKRETPPLLSQKKGRGGISAADKSPSQKEIHAALEKEAQAIRARIPKGAAVIAMCVEGRLLSSEALAQQLAGYAAGGTSKVCFLVGGSFGLDEGIKREASLRLSMSPMTFPHHLARVMLAEQIYRACTINAGTQYHK